MTTSLLPALGYAKKNESAKINERRQQELREINQSQMDRTGAHIR